MDAGAVGAANIAIAVVEETDNEERLETDFAKECNPELAGTTIVAAGMLEVAPPDGKDVCPGFEAVRADGEVGEDAEVEEGACEATDAAPTGATAACGDCVDAADGAAGAVGRATVATAEREAGGAAAFPEAETEAPALGVEEIAASDGGKFTEVLTGRNPNALTGAEVNASFPPNGVVTFPALDGGPELAATGLSFRPLLTPAIGADVEAGEPLAVGSALRVLATPAEGDEFILITLTLPSALPRTLAFLFPNMEASSLLPIPGLPILTLFPPTLGCALSPMWAREAEVPETGGLSGSNKAAPGNAVGADDAPAPG